MMIGDFVIYQGTIHKITRTYNDSTVDLDYDTNVKQNEVELV